MTDEEIYHVNRVGAPRVQPTKVGFTSQSPTSLFLPNKRQPNDNPWIRQETIRKKMELEHGEYSYTPRLDLSNQGKYLITDPDSCRKRSQGSVTVD